MKISGSVALVTGANRGLGRAFARALVERGATVYAGARDPGTITDPGLIPVKLDVTDPRDIAAVAARCDDVTLLVNNAGVAHAGPILDSLDAARQEMEINYFGTLALSRAFAPILGATGGGALVNMLSVLSYVSFPGLGSYSASKAAAWSLTNGIRLELAEQGTLVVGVHAGFIDTDMAAGAPPPKLDPDDVAAQTFDAVEEGRPEVWVDEVSRQARAGLSGDLEVLYPTLRR
jgi:NAD(P)-dependent dehydrogenase (short-subunit alcohol dehydrogenase family)